MANPGFKCSVATTPKPWMICSQFCASRPLSRALLMEWKAGMESLSPSTINVRLSAVRKMLTETKRNGNCLAKDNRRASRQIE
jgi:hypothetical protein